MMHFDEGALVGVLTTQPIDRVLDYKAPEGGVMLGAFVEVPLGPRKVIGVVWGKGKGDYDYNKIRAIIRVLCYVLRPAPRAWVIHRPCAKSTGLERVNRIAPQMPAPRSWRSCGTTAAFRLR